MKTITIRVDDVLFEKIDEKRGNKSKSDFYREITAEYLKNKVNKEEEDLNKSEYIANLEKDIESLKNEMKHKEELLKAKEERIKDLQNQLGWIQSEYNKLSGRFVLPPSKKWWQFWRK